jgi:hypothetical protein
MREKLSQYGKTPRDWNEQAPKVTQDCDYSFLLGQVDLVLVVNANVNWRPRILWVFIFLAAFYQFIVFKVLLINEVSDDAAPNVEVLDDFLVIHEFKVVSGIAIVLQRLVSISRIDNELVKENGHVVVAEPLELTSSWSAPGLSNTRFKSHLNECELLTEITAFQLNRFFRGEIWALEILQWRWHVFKAAVDEINVSFKLRFAFIVHPMSHFDFAYILWQFILKAYSDLYIFFVNINCLVITQAKFIVENRLCRYWLDRLGVKSNQIEK